MLAKLVKIGLSLFITLILMSFIAALIFFVIGVFVPASLINNNVVAWVLLSVGFTITIGSGVLIFRRIYRGFDAVMNKLGKEEVEVRQWVQSFYNTSSDSNRIRTSSTRAVDDPPGPGKSRANYSPLLPLLGHYLQ